MTARPAAVPATVLDRLPAVVDRVRKVPDAYREFAVPDAEAHRRFGIDGALLRRLLDLGLPHRGQGEGIRCDRLDLENVSAGLDLPSAQRTVMMRWQRALRDRSGTGRGAYEVRLSWKCPEPGHDGPCAFTAGPRLPGPVPESLPGDRPGAVTVLASPLHDATDFGHALDPLVALARRITFHQLPTELAADLTFLADTGLADCRLATRHLVDAARCAGLTVRPASGFFIGAPFPTEHTWFEVRVADRWVAADPFFLKTLHRWGILDPQEWPMTRSPRNVLWRLAADYWQDLPLVRHGDRHAVIRAVARWLPEAGPRHEPEAGAA